MIRLTIEYDQNYIEGLPYVRYMETVAAMKTGLGSTTKRVVLEVLDEHYHAIGKPAEYPIPEVKFDGS